MPVKGLEPVATLEGSITMKYSSLKLELSVETVRWLISLNVEPTNVQSFK